MDGSSRLYVSIVHATLSVKKKLNSIPQQGRKNVAFVQRRSHNSFCATSSPCFQIFRLSISKFRFGLTHPSRSIFSTVIRIYGCDPIVIPDRDGSLARKRDTSPVRSAWIACISPIAVGRVTRTLSSSKNVYASRNRRVAKIGSYE
jgi:hypothetical protein